MQSSELFPKPDLLEEKPTDNDLVNVEDEVKRVSARIDRFIEQKRSAIVAYLGPFGAGKSSTLRMIEGQKESYKWVAFELWRYANRQDIWDGFVIQVAAALNDKSSESDMADRVEGRFPEAQKAIMQFGLLIMITFVIALVVSFGLWTWLKGTSTFDLFSRAFLKYAVSAFLASVLLVGAGNLLLKLRVFQGKRPLRRVFELETLLKNSLLELDKPLVVVTEDVDRTTDDGAVFLETLKYFIDKNTSTLKQPILVVAPQTRNAFDIINNSGLTGFERSLKIYDETIYFGALLNDGGIEKFFNTLEVDTKYRGKLIEATKLLLNSYRGYITIRFLKHILREVSSFVDARPDSDPVIVMVVMIARYIPVRNNPNEFGTALSKVFSGSAYNNDGVTPFFRALIVAYDGPRQSFARRFTAHFEDIESEIEYETVTQQNVIEGHIKLNRKYQPLLESTF